jgi:hypothetical protein
MAEQSTSLVKQESHVVYATFVVLFVTVLCFVWANSDPHFPLILLVVCAGALGGLVSLYRRVQLIPAEKRTAPELLAGKEISFQIYMSPVLGAILSFVLYIALLTGFVHGTIFPDFTIVETPYTDPPTFLRSAVPKGNADVAKILFWAFIAGFSERFVPNILDRLAKR